MWQHFQASSLQLLRLDLLIEHKKVIIHKRDHLRRIKILQSLVTEKYLFPCLIVF